MQINFAGCPKLKNVVLDHTGILKVDLTRSIYLNELSICDTPIQELLLCCPKSFSESYPVFEKIKVASIYKCNITVVGHRGDDENARLIIENVFRNS
jgi:hypothetical protein